LIIPAFRTASVRRVNNSTEAAGTDPPGSRARQQAADSMGGLPSDGLPGPLAGLPAPPLGFKD
jgi:hypothetical protein